MVHYCSRSQSRMSPVPTFSDSTSLIMITMAETGRFNTLLAVLANELTNSLFCSLFIRGASMVITGMILPPNYEFSTCVFHILVKWSFPNSLSIDYSLPES